MNLDYAGPCPWVLVQLTVVNLLKAEINLIYMSEPENVLHQPVKYTVGYVHLHHVQGKAHEQTTVVELPE